MHLCKLLRDFVILFYGNTTHNTKFNIFLYLGKVPAL